MSSSWMIGLLHNNPNSKSSPKYQLGSDLSVREILLTGNSKGVGSSVPGNWGKLKAFSNTSILTLIQKKMHTHTHTVHATLNMPDLV